MAKGIKCTLVITSKPGVVTKRVKCASMAEARKIGKSSPGFCWIIQDEDEYETLDGGKCAGLE